MKTKICIKCKEDKELSEFHKDKSKPDGYYCYCKLCRSQKENIIETQQLFEENLKRCSKCNEIKDLSEFYKHKDCKFGVRPDCKKCIELYQLENKEKIQKKAKARNFKNKEKNSIYNKKHHELNKEEINKRQQKYYQDNKEKELQRSKKYREIPKNKERQNKLHTIYTRERRRNDSNYKLLCNLRNRMCDTISKGQKSLSTMSLTGCEIDYLMYHLQSQFTEGMTWGNYGRGWNGKKEWQIDHIKPCSKFDMSKKSEQLKCFNFKNLQPLWAEENLKKKDKF